MEIFPLFFFQNWQKNTLHVTNPIFNFIFESECEKQYYSVKQKEKTHFGM